MSGIHFSPTAKARAGSVTGHLVSRFRSFTTRPSSKEFARDDSLDSAGLDSRPHELRSSHTTDAEEETHSLDDFETRDQGSDDDAATTPATSPRFPGKDADSRSLANRMQCLQDDNVRLREQHVALEKERDAAVEREEVLGTALFEQTRKAAELDETKEELVKVREELDDAKEQYSSIEERYVELKLKMAETLAELDSERVERQALEHLASLRKQTDCSPVRALVPPPGSVSPMLPPKAGKPHGVQTPLIPVPLQRGFAESIPFRMGENGESIGWESSMSINRSITTPGNMSSYDSDRERLGPVPSAGMGQRASSERFRRRQGDDDDESVASTSPSFMSLRWSAGTDDSSSVGDGSVCSDVSGKRRSRKKVKKKKKGKGGTLVALSRVQALKELQGVQDGRNEESYAKLLAVDL